MKRSHMILVVSLFYFSTGFSQLTINTVINPPFPTDLDYYIDDLSNVYINIVNTDPSSTFRYRLEADIQGPTGITANIRYLGQTITIGPGQTQFYSGMQLRDLGMSSGGIENTHNLTEEQMSAISINHALPEGAYTICFRAFDENDNSLSDPSEGCASFELVYIDRPEIVLPIDEAFVFPQVNVNWLQDLSSLTPMQRSRLIYRLSIGDATQDELDQYMDEIYDVNTPSIRHFETPASTYPFVNGVDYNFIEGHEYVVWVTAIDPEGELMFLDRGNSNVVRFTYGTEEDEETDDDEYNGCVTEEFSTSTCADPWAEMYFPSHQDTLPFTQFPFLLKFDPYCASYQRLQYTLILTEQPSGLNIYNRNDDLNWPPGGPLQYLLDRGFTTDADHARLFMMNDSWLTPTFQRSRSYRAEVNASMHMRAGPTFTYSMANDFVSGMPKPGLDLPEHQDTLAPGDIEFRWDNGALPLHVFPDVFNLIRIHGAGEPEDITYYGDVHEKWVLQISRSEHFETSNLVSGFSEEVNGAHFESVEDLMAGIYLVNNQTKEILEEGTYYWRVVWLRDPDDVVPANFYIADGDFYHSSSTRIFVIDGDAGTPGDPEEEEEEESTCSAPCEFPSITDHDAVGGLSVGTNFTIAGFTVEVREVSGSASGFSGQGYIRMPLLNNIKLRVQFSSLQINAARKAFHGQVTPVTDTALPFSEFISPLGRIVGMTQTEAEAMDAAIEGTGKLISLLTPGSETALPIGIDKEIDGSRIIIGIIDLMLKPDSARMKAVVNIDLPNMEIVEGFISLGADVCITPTGFANDVRLYLPQDQVFDLGNGNEFVIAGAENDRPDNQVTSVEWDCEGFRALNITGIHRFTRDWLLPEGADGNVEPEGKVEARFTGRFVRGGNIMVNIDMDPFQLPGVEGWGFTVAHNAWIDLSDLENPEHFMTALPDDYVHPALTDDGMANTWKGFFLEEVSVHTPEHLQGADGHPLTFALRNIFIDNTGLTFSARAENILRWDGDGDMAGWKASLDTFFLDILQNNFRQAGFNGKLGIPIADETQYLKYRAALEYTDGNFALVLSVRPAAAMRIPISMAEATILPTTYIRAVIADSSFIEANLSATLTLGNSNLPSGSSMPASLTMPGIRIENLRINSEVGFDTTDFAFSLTGLDGLGSMGGAGGGGHGYFEADGAEWMPPPSSGQSSLSGFPIGLDHFSFSNEGITIQPRITLTGSEGGFSAAAKILLNADMELLPRQRFTLTGVTLQRIDLDIEASDITLRGYLEFYKEAATEGVRGGITLGLNLGTRIGIDINADFGTYKTATATVFDTPGWYSYFYVDGTVFISSGIQIFSGLSLYGLGGGFYHHMVMTSSLPASTSIAGASSSGRPSGVRYAPNFSNDLGLKFKVILGSNGDEGKAYNLDVGLQAEFSFTHGLTLLAFEGSFRVMTDGISISTIGREGNSPVAGYLGMELNLPPGAPATFNGQFFVKVKVPVSSPILTGIGTIPNPPTGWTSENALIWANFYVGPDKWFFHMGSPTNRGGLRLRIGDVDVARITGYMMIGHDIPVLMPEPDAEFTRIFNLGRGGEVNSAAGDPASLTAGRPRPSVPLGEGFAFGIALAMHLGADFFPFYFDLASVMGCDINVTRATDGDRTCAGTGTIPGVDGWYGIGQFYAGIEGSFGIRINLFVETITVPILQASAAIILRGGLPNPEWVAGRGSFYYNVCNGLAEGSCDFALQAGTVCLPVSTGNPFGDMSLLQDLKPDEGETVEVYAEAAAAFSMQMNRVYEIEEYVTAIDPPSIRRIEPYMYAFEIKLNGRGAPIAGTGEWAEHNRVYNFYPAALLRGESDYTARVEARIRENGRDFITHGSVFKEELLHHFRTGPMPDRIVPQMINFTYPYIRQQNFLKSETRSDQGYIVLFSRNPLLSVEGDVSNVDVSFTARFTSEDREVINTPAIIEGERIIKFNVSQLQADKLYCLQIIRRDQPRGVISLPGNMSLNDITGGPVGGSMVSGIAALQIQNLYAVLGRSTVMSNQFTRVSLPSGRVRQYEKELFNYFFRTSDYNDFTSKLASEQSDWDKETLTFGVDVIKLENSFTENLEWVDVNPFQVVPNHRSVSFSKRVDFYLRPPLNIEFDTYTPGSVYPSQYFTSIVAPRIMRPYLEGVGMRTRVISNFTRDWGVNVSAHIPQFPLFEGYTSYGGSIYFSTTTPYKNPLDDSSINESFSESTGMSGIPLPTIAHVPLLPVGFHPPPLRRTAVMYGVHVNGMIQYRHLQRDMRHFAYQTLTLPVGVGTVTTSPYEIMGTEDKNYVTRILSNDPITATKLTKGPNSFGFIYKYPLPDGSDTHNGYTPFTFQN
ncbi:MAG: hypothetical protein WAT91_03295 [Saprospiraceae bacterium]